MIETFFSNCVVSITWQNKWCRETQCIVDKLCSDNRSMYTSKSHLFLCCILIPEFICLSLFPEENSRLKVSFLILQRKFSQPALIIIKNSVAMSPKALRKLFCSITQRQVGNELINRTVETQIYNTIFVIQTCFNVMALIMCPLSIYDDIHLD